MIKCINISESRFVSALMAVMLVFVLCSCTKERTAVREKEADSLCQGFTVDTTWDDTIYVPIQKLRI